MTMNLGDSFAPIPLAGSPEKLQTLRLLLQPRPRS